MIMWKQGEKVKRAPREYFVKNDFIFVSYRDEPGPMITIWVTLRSFNHCGCWVIFFILFDTIFSLYKDKQAQTCDGLITISASQWHK